MKKYTQALDLMLLLEEKCVNAILLEAANQNKELARAGAREILGKIGGRILFGDDVLFKTLAKDTK